MKSIIFMLILFIFIAGFVFVGYKLAKANEAHDEILRDEDEGR